METFGGWLRNTHQWMQADFNSHPLRFTLEITAWVMSIACATWMGITLPHPPFFILYPLFITQCAIFTWASWTRGSFGMLANYLLLMTIDLIALARLILVT
jgi:hypothetical protein